MAKYMVRFQSIEYYEKEYEADSVDDAIQMYYNSDGWYWGTPYDTETAITEVEDENGVLSYD